MWWGDTTDVRGGKYSWTRHGSAGGHNDPGHDESVPEVSEGAGELGVLGRRGPLSQGRAGKDLESCPGPRPSTRGPWGRLANRDDEVRMFSRTLYRLRAPAVVLET